MAAMAITAFSFTSALNSAAGISTDVAGTITGTTIYMTDPIDGHSPIDTNHRRDASGGEP